MGNEEEKQVALGDQAPRRDKYGVCELEGSPPVLALGLCCVHLGWPSVSCPILSAFRNTIQVSPLV